MCGCSSKEHNYIPFQLLEAQKLQRQLLRTVEDTSIQFRTVGDEYTSLEQ